MTGRAGVAAIEIDRRVMFARLADGQLDTAYRIAGVILGSGGDAEDAAHDAVVRAWRSFATLRDTTKFEAWFQRILVNVCRDRLRKRRRSPVTELDMAGTTVGPDGFAGIDDDLPSTAPSPG